MHTYSPRREATVTDATLVLPSMSLLSPAWVRGYCIYSSHLEAHLCMYSLTFVKINHVFVALFVMTS